MGRQQRVSKLPFSYVHLGTITRGKLKTIFNVNFSNKLISNSEEKKVINNTSIRFEEVSDLVGKTVALRSAYRGHLTNEYAQR